MRGTGNFVQTKTYIFHKAKINARTVAELVQDITNGQYLLLFIDTFRGAEVMCQLRVY
jgi:hypothetical protein